MSQPEVCRELGHQWPSDLLVVSIEPQAIAEIACTRCGIVKTTIIDDVSIRTRWSLEGTIISETVEPKAQEPSP